MTLPSSRHTPSSCHCSPHFIQEEADFVLTPGDMWQCLEIFWLSPLGGVEVASIGLIPGMLVNIHRARTAPPQRRTQPQRTTLPTEGCPASLSFPHQSSPASLPPGTMEKGRRLVQRIQLGSDSAGIET